MNKNIQRIGVVISFVLQVTSLNAQQVELLGESGLIMPSINPPSNELLKESRYFAGDMRIAWQRDTQKVYSNVYRDPFYGLGFYAATFSNTSIGDPLALYFYIKTPLRCSEKWNIYFEIGSGVAGNINPYNKELNPRNMTTGARINMFGRLGMGVERKFSKHFSLGINIGYRHFSNGFMQWPNYGINVIPITLNAAFSKNNMHGARQNIPAFKKENHFILFYAPGSKNFYAGEKNYFTSTLAFQYIRQLNYVVGIGGGADIFYNASGPDKIQSNETKLGKTLSYRIHGTFEWFFTERFSVNTCFGVYLKQHPENDEHFPYYERICARYRFFKGLFAGIGIKINGNSADYIEWTLGYSIHGNPKPETPNNPQ